MQNRDCWMSGGSSFATHPRRGRLGLHVYFQNFISQIFVGSESRKVQSGAGRYFPQEQPRCPTTDRLAAASVRMGAPKVPSRDRAHLKKLEEFKDWQQFL